MTNYTISEPLKNELIRTQGARRAAWFEAHWQQWVSAGSYINPPVTYFRYDAPLINPAPMPTVSLFHPAMLCEAA